jgi:hypothetical protein
MELSDLKEPEGSSPCSQEPSTGPYPEPVRSSPIKDDISTENNYVSNGHLSQPKASATGQNEASESHCLTSNSTSGCLSSSFYQIK